MLTKQQNKKKITPPLPPMPHLIKKLLPPVPPLKKLPKTIPKTSNGPPVTPLLISQSKPQSSKPPSSMPKNQTKTKWTKWSMKNSTHKNSDHQKHNPHLLTVITKKLRESKTSPRIQSFHTLPTWKRKTSEESEDNKFIYLRKHNIIKR